MKANNTKLHSFTIIELVTVLVVSSIVMILAVSFLQKAWLSLKTIKTQVEESNKTYSFFSNMQAEINGNESFYFEDEKIEIYNGDTLKFEYIIEEERIIKQAEMYSDTLNIAVFTIDTSCWSFSKNDNVLKSISFVLDEKATKSVYVSKNFNRQQLYNMHNTTK